jgi:hypothetical protein
MTNERWLRWAMSKHLRGRRFRVDMKGVKLGNAVIDGEVVGNQRRALVTSLVVKIAGHWINQLDGR